MSDSVFIIDDPDAPKPLETGRLSHTLSFAAHLAQEDKMKDMAAQAKVRSFSRLVLWPDPILSTDCAVVAKDGLPEGLLEGMLSILQRSMFGRQPGAAIAAPQVGCNLKVAILRMAGHTLAMVNPQIVAHGGTWERRTEGCLSIPGYVTTRQRYHCVTVRFTDAASGQQRTLKLDDRDDVNANFEGRAPRWVTTRNQAQAVQHELDHLDGICCVAANATRQQRRQMERIIEDAQTHPDYERHCKPVSLARYKEKEKV